jgi:hypothetical protein
MGRVKITSLNWKDKYLKDMITLLTEFTEHLTGPHDLSESGYPQREISLVPPWLDGYAWGSVSLWTMVATCYQAGNCGPWLTKNCDITVAVLDIRLVFYEELGSSRGHDLTWMLRCIAFHLSFASSSSSTFSDFCRFLRPKSQQIV